MLYGGIGGLAVRGLLRLARLIDPLVDKVGEWVDRPPGHVRADMVHERLVAVGFGGDECTTRRAVVEAKARWRAGHRRTYRPWIHWLWQLRTSHTGRCCELSPLLRSGGAR